MEKKKTPLYGAHSQLGAKLVDFAGWMMPLQYQGIKAEHLAVRNSAGLFDVSHMGRIIVEGEGALQAVQYWITNDASKLKEGQSLYTPICNPSGGIIDDCIVYKFKPDRFIIVVNAANRKKDYDWFIQNLPSELEEKVKIHSPEEGDQWALLALQGPKSRELLGKIASEEVESLQKNHFREISLGKVEGCIVASTGYTGEDGFEIFVPSESAEELWWTLLREGESFDLKPCGLGARDTLRLEMRYPLYGQDIDETTTPLEAGLGWTVKLQKGPFIGREALAEQKEKKPNKKIAGFTLLDKAIPRPGYQILDAEGRELGKVTSGGFSYCLNQPIGIGYVPPQYAKPDTQLFIRVRNRTVEAKVVKTPFYKRENGCR